jgi:hypothetical protein
MALPAYGTAEHASMLPGFRFLFTAVILSVSVLVFGLGAAALLRAAHEEFANLPSRRLAPEPAYARLADNSIPTLSLLRVDPPAPEKPVADVLGIATPDVAVAPAEQAPEADPTELEQLAALKPEQPVSAESATTDAPAAVVAEMPAAPTDTPVADPEVMVAAIAETPAAPAPSPAERPSDVLRLEDNAAATRIAALGSPTVILDPTDAKPDRSTIRKRSAQRARERRRIAARRARLAREASAAQQRIHQENNPFAPALLGRPTR